MVILLAPLFLLTKNNGTEVLLIPRRKLCENFLVGFVFIDENVIFVKKASDIFSKNVIIPAINNFVYLHEEHPIIN